MWFFRKKSAPDIDQIVHEKWTSSFGLFNEQRFEDCSGSGYEAAAGGGAFELRLSRRNLFAWADDPMYRYDDFYLEAELRIPPENGYSSAGFLFRRIGESTYYYFLVSNKGYFRFDLVFNGNPSVLIDWTPCGWIDPQAFTLGILADGSRFLFRLDGRTAAAAADESIPAGRISYAGQNYDEKDTALFRLNRISIESRSAVFGALRDNIVSEPPEPRAIMNFAETQIRGGRYSAALVALRKISGEAASDPGLLFMQSEAYAGLGLYEEAEECLGRISGDAERGRKAVSLAGIYYMTNRFIELRDVLSDAVPDIAGNPAAYNLLGNAEYALGNHAAASAAYLEACRLEPEQPYYHVNSGRALERSGNAEAAMDAYRKASGCFFRQDDYDGLAGLVPLMERICPGGSDSAALKAKVLFHDGSMDEAGKILERLAGEGCGDSAVYYLYALCLEKAGADVSEITGLCRKAAELEPGFYLYHYKLAESLFPDGEGFLEELERAEELCGGDPWVMNLRGLYLQHSGDFNGAAVCFRNALKAGGSSEIEVNLSEALYLGGHTEEALEAASGDDPVLLNQKGNILSRTADRSGAVRCYEAALNASPGSADIMLNLAAVCIEEDLFSRAEELLVRVLDSEENAQAYNLLGNLALLRGETSRAEAAYRRALETEPGFPDAVCNLAEFLITRSRLLDADLLLSSHAGTTGERGAVLSERVRRLRMDVHACGKCGREWVVPKDIAGEGALRLVGEPSDDMPAGRCRDCGRLLCVGCAREGAEDGRLICDKCGGPLKLSGDWMRYLLRTNSLDK